VDVEPAQPAEREPDYRMSLAAERTYLAYLRTGLALTAAGVGVAGALPHASASGLRRGIGLVLVLVGAVVMYLARRRWIAVDQAMRRGAPLPSTGLIRSASWVLVAIAIAAAVLVFFL
jgi:putative membrane protein